MQRALADGTITAGEYLLGWYYFESAKGSMLDELSKVGEGALDYHSPPSLLSFTEALMCASLSSYIYFKVLKC